MKYQEIYAFIVYLLAMLGSGVFFFFKDRNGGEKSCFLGNRNMGAWGGALSCGGGADIFWMLFFRSRRTGIYELFPRPWCFLRSDGNVLRGRPAPFRPGR